MLENIYFSNSFKLNLIKEIDILLKASLETDIGENGDVTSDSILNKNEIVTAKLYAKQNGIFSGGFLIEKVFDKIDPKILIFLDVAEGKQVKENQLIARIKGKIKSILTGERTALNFISRTSGVSTYTNKFVQIGKRYGVKVLDTRKTIPGWRYLDKYAVKMGGGENHRIGLFDMVLLKENHIYAAGGIASAVDQCRKYLQNNNLQLKIEVETRTFEEVKDAVKAQVDRIMLDNMSLKEIEHAVKLVNGKSEIEVSGGVNLEVFESLAQTGIDYISIGRITHSAPAFDFSLLLDE